MDMEAIEKIMQIKEQPEQFKTSSRATLREELRKVVQEQIPKIPGYLEEMMPEQRMGALIKLMPFVFPPMESISASAEEWEW